MESRTVRIVVRGRVQGVGFRAWTQHQAELHGLEGWVRNRRDGTVEAVLSGPNDLVDAMVRILHRGPAGARVDGVDLDGAADRAIPEPHSGRFEVLRTE